MVTQSRFKAFFRFSALDRPPAAVRLTAFVPAAVALTAATGIETFESDTPKGAGEVRRSLLELVVVPFSFVALLCGDDEEEVDSDVVATGEVAATAGPLKNSAGLT